MLAAILLGQQNPLCGDCSQVRLARSTAALQPPTAGILSQTQAPPTSAFHVQHQWHARQGNLHQTHHHGHVPVSSQPFHSFICYLFISVYLVSLKPKFIFKSVEKSVSCSGCRISIQTVFGCSLLVWCVVCVVVNARVSCLSAATPVSAACADATGAHIACVRTSSSWSCCAV